MADESTAGDEARTDRDAPTTEKPDAVVLGRGETRIPDEDADLLTDGGVDTAEDLEHDPRGFDFPNPPAIVVEVGKDDVTDKICFADVQLRECGALYWTEWTGADGLLPEWRWAEVRYLATERAERGGASAMARVAPEDWYRLPNAVQGMVDQDDDEMDSADLKDTFVDGGER